MSLICDSHDFSLDEARQMEIPAVSELDEEVLNAILLRPSDYCKYYIQRDSPDPSDPLALKFDPISRELTSRAMCAEFINMIKTLLDESKATLPNATRYSYLVGQQVDLETQQIDTFSGCVRQ